MSGSNTNSRPWALITGASEGLGAEFARQLAERQTHNLILVARTEAKLRALADKLADKVECKVLPADLSKPGIAEKIDKDTRQYDVAVLINNAGIASGGSFEEMELKDIQQMLAVNIVSMTELFYFFLPRINEQNRRLADAQASSKHGLAGIINLSSMAAFMPLPSMALYAASKTFFLQLSEAVYQEQRNEGSNIRIVCCLPGPTKTEIWSKGGAHEAGVLMPMDTPDHVVRATFGALDAKNKPLLIPGYMNNVAAIVTQHFSPRFLARIVSRRIMGQDPALRDAEEVKAAFAKLGREAPKGRAKK